jgi:hypothetical protein
MPTAVAREVAAAEQVVLTVTTPANANYVRIRKSRTHPAGQYLGKRRRKRSLGSSIDRCEPRIRRCRRWRTEVSRPTGNQQGAVVALDQKELAEFVQNFARVLVTAWSSEEYSARLGTDPRSALAEAGLHVPANSDIAIVRSALAEGLDGTVAHQVGLWQQGLATGHFELHIPDAPQIDTAELAESDLLGVSGGVNPIDVTCCCAPPGCCTVGAP